jgi:F-type H+-transporting ATPase subunit a
LRKFRAVAIGLALVILVLAGFLFLRAPKPIIELKAEALFSIGPFDVTNTYVTSWIVIIFISLFAYAATRRMSLAPRGIQNLFEGVIEAIYNLVVATAGEKHGRRFFPVVATILIYVAISNWFGLLPFFATTGKVEEIDAHHEAFHEEGVVIREVAGLNIIMPGADGVELPKTVTLPDGRVEEVESGSPVEVKELAIEEATRDMELREDEKVGVLIPFLRSVNTDLNAPLALAVWSAIFVEFWGISTYGFFRYAGKFFNFGRLLRGKIVDGLIDVFVGILEFIAEAARLISFTFRLFGNIFAGEILFLVVIFLLPLVALQAVYFLELFVGLIQAFIFAMLTLVFGVIAVAAPHGESEGHRPVEKARRQ